MQNKKLLPKKALILINVAKNHIKKTYQQNLTSIASALLTKKGNIYTGINLKYRKFYKCICAERIALAKAIESKDKDFDLIVSVKYDKEKNDFYVINMCGECRQIFINHAPIKVIVDSKGILKLVTIEKIFPYPYC